MGDAPPDPEPKTRKSVTLPDSLWAEIDEVRRSAPGRVPSEAEALRQVIRAGLDVLRRRGGRNGGGGSRR